MPGLSKLTVRVIYAHCNGTIVLIFMRHFDQKQTQRLTISLTDGYFFFIKFRYIYCNKLNSTQFHYHFLYLVYMGHELIV